MTIVIYLIFHKGIKHWQYLNRTYLFCSLAHLNHLHSHQTGHTLVPQVHTSYYYKQTHPFYMALSYISSCLQKIINKE